MDKVYKMKPGQVVKILRIEIAVPTDVGNDCIADEISALLTDRGMRSKHSSILDWRYTIDPDEAGMHPVYLDKEEPVEEGEVFSIHDHDENIRNNDE
jgi:hypothetical protein